MNNLNMWCLKIGQNIQFFSYNNVPTIRTMYIPILYIYHLKYKRNYLIHILNFKLMSL